MPKFRLRQVLTHGLTDIVSVGSFVQVTDNARVVKLTELSTLPGNPDSSVLAIAASPLAALVATASRDGIIRIYSLATTELVGQFEAHTGAVKAIAFSPLDKRLLVSGGEDTALKFWNCTTRAPIDIDPNSSSSGRIAANKKSGGASAADGDVDDEDTFASPTSHSASLTEHSGFINAVAFSSDGIIIASGGNDDRVILWQAPVDITTATNAVASAAATAAAALGDGSAALSSAPSNNKSNINDSFTAASVKIFSAPVKLAVLEGHSFHVTALKFSKDSGSLLSPQGVPPLASAGAKGRLSFWEYRGRKTPVLDGDFIQIGTSGGDVGIISMDWSPDGKRIVAACSDKLVRQFSVESRKELGAALVGHEAPVQVAKYSPDGQLLVTACEKGSLKLWQAGNGKLVTTLRNAHDGCISSISFVDNRALFTASLDGSAKLFLVSRGNPRDQKIRMPSAVSDLAIAGDGTLFVQDVAGNHKFFPITVVWQPDEDKKECNACKKEFTMLNRRSHCRLCGLLFDSPCVQWAAKNAKGEEVKVCAKCKELDLVVQAKIREAVGIANSPPPPAAVADGSNNDNSDNNGNNSDKPTDPNHHQQTAGGGGGAGLRREDSIAYEKASAAAARKDSLSEDSITRNSILADTAVLDALGASSNSANLEMSHQQQGRGNKAEHVVGSERLAQLDAEERRKESKQRLFGAERDERAAVEREEAEGAAALRVTAKNIPRAVDMKTMTPAAAAAAAAASAAEEKARLSRKERMAGAASSATANTAAAVKPTEPISESADSEEQKRKQKRKQQEEEAAAAVEKANAESAEEAEAVKNEELLRTAARKPKACGCC